MPEQSRMSADSSDGTLDYISSLLIAVTVFLLAGLFIFVLPAFVAIEVDINFFVAQLFVLLFASGVVLGCWWLTGRVYFVRLLNKMAKEDVFMVRTKQGWVRTDEYTTK